MLGGPAMIGARLLALEWRVVRGAETALPLLALVAITLLHRLLPASGPESWRSLFVETCQSYVPIAVALAVVPALLRDQEHGRLEAAIALPARGVASARLVLLLGGSALLTVLWLALLAAFWGPVPFGAGLFAALGPTLLLSGLGLGAAASAGRSTVGYLVVIAWPLGDLILQLLGAFRATHPLQWLDVFAYRWPVAAPAWQAVAAAQALAGALLLAIAVTSTRTRLRRLL